MWIASTGLNTGAVAAEVTRTSEKTRQSDGVNITNAGYGALGSYSIGFGSLGNGEPFDFVKETQVKTGGYEAEFGESTGGVVNVVTKSGTNTLRGTAFGYVRPESLESSYDQVTTVNGTVNISDTRSSDAGIATGGAVMPNHVFFFGAIDPQWQRTATPPGVGAAGRSTSWWRTGPDQAKYRPSISTPLQGSLAGADRRARMAITLATDSIAATTSSASVRLAERL
jgi:hypothetical protein